MASNLADGPLPLFSTPCQDTGKNDAFTLDASHMALVHLVIIRGYNSIYKQAPRIQPRDVSDFLGYCNAWIEMVLGHHHSEEAVLFPMLAAASGVPDLMDTDKDEHEAFYGGLETFKKYLDEVSGSPDPKATFDGARVVTLMDGFGQVLHTHLRNEPAHLASLSKYPDIDLEPIRKATEQDSMQRTNALFLLPMLWFNHDVDYEGGRWNGFPGLPMPMKWVMVNVFGWWRSNWWRFGSVDRNGKLKSLEALR